MPSGIAVLVVAEATSLGQAIGDLLRSADLPTEVVTHVEGAGVPAGLRERYPVIVVASRGYLCPTGRRWQRGELPGTALVVVGSRDPMIEATPGIRLVRLPLEPPQLLGTIQGLLARARRPSGPATGGSKPFRQAPPGGSDAAWSPTTPA